MSVALIVNRQAEKLFSGRLLDAYARMAAGVRVYETRSIEELAQVADGFRANRPDVVVLAGGDGSYSAGVTALLRVFGSELPAVAFAPGGTVSTVARNWGMHGPRIRYAKRLLVAVQNGHAIELERPTLRVNDRIGFIFGAGLVASFFREYYASPHRGSIGAARIVAPIFFGSFVGSARAKRVLEPVACELAIDGVVQTARGYSLVAASVVKDLGLHMWVTYRAGETLERFHAVASPLGTRKLGPQMPRVLLGRRLRGEHHVDALAHELSIAFAGRGAWVLDGDRIEGDRVKVTSGPRIRLVTPP